MIFINNLLPATGCSLFDLAIKLIPLLTPFIAGTAAWLAYKSFKRQRQLHQEKLSFDFEFFYLNDIELKKHRDKINNLLKKKSLSNSDLERLANKENEDENGTSIMFILNTWETCAHAIKEGVFNEDYIYHYISDIAIKTHQSLEPFINKRIKDENLKEKTDKENAKDNIEEVKTKTTYIYFRWLVHRWMLRKAIEGDKHKELSLLVANIAKNIDLFNAKKKSKKDLIVLYEKSGTIYKKG